jgi:hypothetical protein
MEFSNMYDSLGTLSSDDEPLSPPMASSSPKIPLNCPKAKVTPIKRGNGKATKPKFNRPLKVLVINFGSIKNKVADLAVCLDINNPDIIIGTETWLRPAVKSEELLPSDKYTIVRKDRKDSYGGVLIAYKNDLIGVHRLDLDTNCEIVWIQIKLVGCKSLTIGAFYRTPDEKDPKYMDELRNSLNKIKGNQNDNIWIGGDFNFGDILWDTQTIRPGSNVKKFCQQMIDLTNDFNFEQLVKEPTREDNILDIFLTNNPTLVVKSSVIPGLSDHDGIPMLL